MPWHDLGWRPIANLPMPQPGTLPPAEPGITETQGQEILAGDAQQIRLLRWMVWSGTGVLMTMGCALAGLIGSHAGPGAWVGLFGLGIFAILTFLVLRQRYRAAISPELRPLAYEWLSWRRSYLDWLEQTRQTYRASLSAEQRQMLDAALQKQPQGFG